MKAEINWNFTQSLPKDTAEEKHLRLLSEELYIQSICPAIGAHIKTQVAALPAPQVLEIGTGIGLSALKMVSVNRKAHITTIEVNPDFYNRAKNNLTNYSSCLRFINSNALEVIPRMNRNMYDLVLIDANPRDVLNYFELALGVVKSGGAILVPHALWQGKVASPVYKDEPEISFRALIHEVVNSETFVSCLSPIGDGILTVTKPK
ncbi:O-methyltransferase [Tropheryma whipplei]|uniref:O-methyltransferase n=1 Tax=Tropheryma whipplei TaxID=2039 RepID=UPI0004BB4FFC|nr:class I SAM-dependent methyltransferase [Tropheryma whipplei]